MQKIHIKVGDFVTIISGSSKKTFGKVTQVNKKSGKIIVKGINLKFKHVKSNIGKGIIKKLEMPIHHSNVKLKN